MNRRILFYFLIFFAVSATFVFNTCTRLDYGQGPTARPDHIILTWDSEPATTQSVTWRTHISTKKQFAEIALASSSPDFTSNKNRIEAENSLVHTKYGRSLHHSVSFRGLSPNTLYAYRVGGQGTWSEWFHFRTASEEAKPFSFIYMGDAQNDVKSHWSRAIRAAYSDSPESRFILYAGDLIDRGIDIRDWNEWFHAVGWIHGMLPAIPSPGNHEYVSNLIGEKEISPYWASQFALPTNGPEGLKESAYYLDYQGVRIISLDSNVSLEKQAVWLENVLRNNPNRWTIVLFHHPVYTASAIGGDNKRLRELWNPLFTQYGVDLLLQGHNHTYARGRGVIENGGKNQAGGPVYVISVSGPKMFELTDERWMTHGGENIQLYQIIRIHGDTLHYQAKTITKELYDEFDLVKQNGEPNTLLHGTSPFIATDNVTPENGEKSETVKKTIKDIIHDDY